MSWRTVTPEKPFFDELGTPSHTGILTELFRRQFATVRSIHPTHSVAGRGPAAESMIAGHHIDDTPCSANSPFGKLADHDAYVLLLGVGLECCTLIHYCEETVAADIYLRPPSETEVYDCRDRHGVTRSVRLRRHRRHPRDFPSFESGLATGGRLSCGSIAGTPWLVFKARDLQGQVLEALLHQAEATLAT
jgi:aminoglycoside 3-N-acetyltransferase